MNKVLEKYIKDNDRKTLKLLKKTFACKSIAEAITEEEQLRNELEKRFSKEIDLIDWQIVKENYNFQKAYTYAKYLTLRTIINQYLENKKLYPYGNDLEEILEKN